MKIDGKVIADKILEDLKLDIKTLNNIPYLAIILVGNDPASLSYIANKQKAAEKIGIKTTLYQFEKNVSEQELLQKIKELNNDDTVHAIIVQQPLPPQIQTEHVLESLDPKKDVDGFCKNSPFAVPSAKAVFAILQNVFNSTENNRHPFDEFLKEKNIIVIGKGITAGKPIAEMFTEKKIRITAIDSQTKNTQELFRNADIIISAAGKHVIDSQDIKQNVILIGLGLHQQGGKMCGDYEEDDIKNIASFYTPAQGGVGPVNIAMLLKNVTKAAKNQ